MGMYDYVAVCADCPNCGSALSDFQTKDSDCVMQHVYPGSIWNFYTSCGKCGTWVEFNKPPPVPHFPSPDETFSEQDVLAMGFIRTISKGLDK